MIRKSTINLRYANKGKLEILKNINSEYVRVVNLFIDKRWKQKQFKGIFTKDTMVDSWLSSRMKQAAAKQALSIVKSQRRKKNKHKPVLTKSVIEFDSRFVKIEQDVNSFDIWIKLSSIGKKIILNIPSRKHYHFNKLLKEGWTIKKSLRLRINEKGCFVDIYFTKDAPVLKTIGKAKAVDIGYKKLIVSSDGEFIGNYAIYEKIACKKQGSKAFKRALTERDEIINKSCKSINLNNTNILYAEDLKNVKHKSKGSIRKKFNNKLQRWSYPKVLNKFAMLCEEKGIAFKKVPPQYTSQRCSKCGVIRKLNRKGETYKCACGLFIDADYNAAMNILLIGEYGLDALQPIP